MLKHRGMWATNMKVVTHLKWFGPQRVIKILRHVHWAISVTIMLSCSDSSLEWIKWRHFLQSYRTTFYPLGTSQTCGLIPILHHTELKLEPRDLQIISTQILLWWVSILFSIYCSIIQHKIINTGEMTLARGVVQSGNRTRSPLLQRLDINADAGW